jgi:hypothetical protein
MTLERTDTRNGLQPGHYTFTICSPVEKGEFKEGKIYYEFNFEVNGNIHTEKIPVWAAAEILRAIGAKEIESDVFEWDKDQVVGINVDADIVMEQSKNGKTYRRMRNITKVRTDEKLPF